MSNNITEQAFVDDQEMEEITSNQELMKSFIAAEADIEAGRYRIVEQ